MQTKLFKFSGRIIDYAYANNVKGKRGFDKFAGMISTEKRKFDDDLSKMAEEEIKEEEKKEEPSIKIVEDEFDPEFLYVRVRACSANVPNNNGDLFTVEELKRTYKTFIGQRVFKNHKSDDVSNSRGQIMDAIWIENEKDPEHPWVECLLKVDRKKDPNLVRGIEKGYISDVSMGCRVQYSVCSCCGNKAYTEDDYCECVKSYKGRDICPAHKGKKQNMSVHEENYGVEFFELSFVTDGADKEAVVKEIVASDAFSKELPERLKIVASALVNTENVMFQEFGIYLRKLAHQEIIADDDMEKANAILNTIKKFC